MQGVVYYLTLSQLQREEISKLGWSNRLSYSKVYLDVSLGMGDQRSFHEAIRLGLYTQAAVVDVPEHYDVFNAEARSAAAEQVFFAMQNRDDLGWARNGNPIVKEVRTSFTRSFSVGDYIRWMEGVRSVCKSIGFEDDAVPYEAIVNSETSADVLRLM